MKEVYYGIRTTYQPSKKKIIRKWNRYENSRLYIRIHIINQKLFSNYLDINKIVNNIINNLKNNIVTTDKNDNPIQKIKSIFGARGKWLPMKNTIMINPIIKIQSRISKRSKERLNSTIRHELDHCATTKYVQLSEKEREKYIEYFLENNKIENSKEEVKARAFMYHILGDGQIPIVGIRDLRYEIQNGIDLKRLNEGITVYKQEKYDEFLGKITHTRYGIETKVAKFIADVIGEEELIRNHSNNDYESIRIAFQNRTGKDLNHLIQELNKKPNYMAKKFLGMFYTIKFEKDKNKKIDKYIKQTFIHSKERKRNTDFVPKYDIDYGKIHEKTHKGQPNREEERTI